MAGERLNLMKKAAQQVVNTMTVADRIAVVQFSSGATLHGRDNKYLFTATRDNIDHLSKKIGRFKADGELILLTHLPKHFKFLKIQ